jgi:hypothetical protein
MKNNSASDIKKVYYSIVKKTKKINLTGEKK